MARFEPADVTSFGGGLNYADHPAAIPPNQWTDCDGFMAQGAVAEQWPAIAAFGSAAGNLGDDPIGIVADAIQDGKILLGLERSGELVLIRRDILSAADTTITRSGGTADPLADALDVLTTGFLNGYQVLAAGLRTGAPSNSSSVIRYLGGATYDTIDPPASEELRPQAILSFGSHLIAGGCARVSAVSTQLPAEGRRIAWSSANDESLWAPDVDNSANYVLLDDVTSMITALLHIGSDAVAICTRQNTYALYPTGRIPAFTRRRILPGRGCTIPRRISNDDYQRIGLWGDTPIGACILSDDDLYLLQAGGGQAIGIGDAIRDYLFSWCREDSGGTFDVSSLLRPIVYHPSWRQLLVPRLTEGTGEVLTWNPDSKAWGRIALGSLTSDLLIRQNVCRGPNAYRWVLWDDARALWAEAVGTGASPAAGFANAYVTTRDFSFGGGRSCYLDDLRLHWEHLTNTATIEVAVAARDEVAVGQGNLGRTISPTFAALGSLTDGAARLEMRNAPVGRFHRLRFKVTAGRARIRGFQLWGKAGGHR